MHFACATCHLLSFLSPREASAFASCCFDHHEHVQLSLVFLALQVLASSCSSAVVLNMQASELGNGPKLGGELVIQSSGEQLAQSSREQVAQSSGEQVAQPSGEQVAQPWQDQKPAFPPEPPPVLGHAGAVFLPDASDLGGSLSSGSFSRVSAINMSSFESARELAVLEPEFPEDWEDAYVVPGLSSEVEAQGSLGDSRVSAGGLTSRGLSGPVVMILLCFLGKARR